VVIQISIVDGSRDDNKLHQQLYVGSANSNCYCKSQGNAAYSQICFSSNKYMCIICADFLSCLLALAKNKHLVLRLS